MDRHRLEFYYDVGHVAPMMFLYLMLPGGAKLKRSEGVPGAKRAQLEKRTERRQKKRQKEQSINSDNTNQANHNHKTNNESTRKEINKKKIYNKNKINTKQPELVRSPVRNEQFNSSHCLNIPV